MLKLTNGSRGNADLSYLEANIKLKECVWLKEEKFSKGYGVSKAEVE